MLGHPNPEARRRRGHRPHRKGGAILIPEVDVAASEREKEALRSRVDELEEEMEDLGLALSWKSDSPRRLVGDSTPQSS
jgi:hypothetical protein